MSAPRTYEVRTYGCQMNVHDSERIGGLLDGAGYVPVAVGERPDVVVFNTCAVRENADNRLYGNLGHLKPVKDAHPDMQIAVGGCLAQKDQAAITARAPHVDVVFGTHNLGSLPVLLERARVEQESQVELLEALEVFPSALPARRSSAASAWVSISVGCDNTCTFCIVPSLRGKERDRRPGEVLREVQVLADQGVVEVTLLGQNVNSYGREFGERGAFADLLRAVGPLVERVRFTSPHPRDFTDDVVAAMAETPQVCPSLHMPLQSGSDAVLRAMRRSYRAERFLGILDRVRARVPDAAITTDIIVGFPGETDEDFEQTLRVVEASRFSGAFTFQYSPRPGTPAASYDGQVPKPVVQERYERLVALQDRITLEGNEAQVGRRVEVLVSTSTAGAAGSTGGPATTGSCTSPRRPACGSATSSRRWSPAVVRTTWRRTARCCRTGVRRRATRGRRGGCRRPRAWRWACPSSGCLRRCRCWPARDRARPRGPARGAAGTDARPGPRLPARVVRRRAAHPGARDRHRRGARPGLRRVGRARAAGRAPGRGTAGLRARRRRRDAALRPAPGRAGRRGSGRAGRRRPGHGEHDAGALPAGGGGRPGPQAARPHRAHAPGRRRGVVGEHAGRALAGVTGRVAGRVVAVVGPTATGKSDLAVELALALGGEVVNADSMQLYEGMDIGTAKLSGAERRGVPHALLDVWPVTRTATAADYQVLCRTVVDDLLARGRTPVVVGGSGLYLRAALDDLRFPGTDPEVRAALETELAQLGAPALHARLAALDPAAAGRMQPENGRRVVRALEVVALQESMPGELSSYAGPGPYDVVWLGLDRDDLAGRVALRVDRMWEQGLVDEVAGLVPRGLRDGVTASRALGYAQALAQLDGALTAEAARQATVVATRRFVRRQRAWFRRDPRTAWLERDGTELGQALRLVEAPTLRS